MTYEMASNEDFTVVLSSGGQVSFPQVDAGISATVATQEYVDNTASALSSQIDAESPLLARSFAIQQQAGWTYDRANGQAMYFRPRYFGMNDGDLFKGIIIRTKDVNLTPFPVVYMRLKRYSDGSVLGISEAVEYPNTANTDVVFRLTQAVALPSKDSYYMIDFATTPDGPAITQFGMRIYVVSGGTNPDCYFYASNIVPVMTVQFYSFAEVIAPSASTKLGQLADAYETKLELNAISSNISSNYYTQAEAQALLAGKADKSDVDPLLFAKYYPDGDVKSTAEFTSGIKYDAPDTVSRTITVKPFCNTGNAENDNNDLSGRVVIPPFVDGDGNGYITDDGTRFKVVGVSNGVRGSTNTSLTAIAAPSTVTTIGDFTFFGCIALISISLPAAMVIGEYAFFGSAALAFASLPSTTSFGEQVFANCSALTSISLPAAQFIDNFTFAGCTALSSISLPAVSTLFTGAFRNCSALISVSLPAATAIGTGAFNICLALSSVDFGDTPRSSVPLLGAGAFAGVPATCKIIVPDDQYDEWVTAPVWSDLVTAGYKFLKHSEWEYARKYETVPTSRTVNGKALSGDVVLTGADIAVSGSGTTKINAALGAKADKTNLVAEFQAHGSYSVGNLCVYDNHIYKCVQDYDGELFDEAYFVLADDVGFLPLNGGCIKGLLRVDSSNYNYGGGVSLVGDGYSLANVLMGIDGGGMHGVFTNGILTAICFKSNTSEPGITLRLVSGGTGLSGTLALAAPNPTAGNLAALDAAGNPADSGIASSSVANKTDIPTLVGETMPSTPTQNELAEAVKKIFTALGGTITP